MSTTAAFAPRSGPSVACGRRDTRSSSGKRLPYVGRDGTSDNSPQPVPLARGQGGVPATKLGELVAFPALRAIALDRVSNGVEQILVAERLRQKRDEAPGSGPVGAMRRDRAAECALDRVYRPREAGGDTTPGTGVDGKGGGGGGGGAAKEVPRGDGSAAAGIWFPFAYMHCS